MSLKSVARRVTESFGLLHQTNLRALRLYIKDHTEEELIKEIAEIEDGRQLRILWEAGLSARLQDAVLEQLNKIS